MMKAGVLVLTVLIPGWFVTQTTNSATAIAVVDMDRAMADSTDGKAAIAKLDAAAGAWRAKIEIQQKEADNLAAELQKQDRVLTDQARNQLSKNLDTARVAVERLNQDAQKDLDTQREDLLRPVYQKTASAVQAYATERGIQLVFDRTALGDGLVYARDTADITTEIIRRLSAARQNAGEFSSADRLQESLLQRTWVEIPQLAPPLTSGSRTATLEQKPVLPTER